MDELVSFFKHSFFTFTESVKFRTAEKHGGVLYVNYRDKWERVCPYNPSQDLKAKLCEEISNVTHSSSKEDKQVNLYILHLEAVTDLSHILQTKTMDSFLALSQLN